MNKPIPYKGSEPYIFISYAHKDAQRVWPIIDQMMRDGYRVWYDEGIDPGTEWDEFIANHIENCSCFIAFLSANYLASDNCKDELNFVRDLNKARLLIHLEPGVVLPSGMRMRLGRLQAIHWYTYDNSADAFAKLYEADELGRCQGEPGEPAPAEPPQPEEEILFQQGEIYYRIGDFRQAASYYIPAAEQGHVEAQFRMGYLCQVDQNHPRAFYWFLQAALQGHAEAQYEVGWSYAFGQGVAQDTTKAMEWFGKAGDQGNADAYFQMGKLCAQSNPPAPTEALIWFRKADSLNHPQAAEWVNYTQAQLDRAAAQAKLRIRAAQGDADAMVQLGKSLLCNDKPKALFWFQKAAQQGNLDAVYEVGMCYYLGSGVAEDNETAIRWMLQAAQQGHADAQYQLSELYRDTDFDDDSDLVADDEDCEEKVHYWLTEAAQQGHRTAQYTLALDFEYGDCVEEDLTQAIYWYRQAAAQGCEMSQQRLKALGDT